MKKGQQAYIQQTNTNPSIQDKNAQIIDWDEDTLPSGNRFFLWILTCIIGPLGLAFCFITQPLFYPELKIGDTAYQDLRATFTGQLENEAATKAARLKARGSVVPVFKPIAIKYDEFDKDIKLELNKVQALQKHLQKNDSNTVNTFNIAAPDYYEIYIARAVPSKEFESFARELSISAQTVNRALPRFSVDNASFWQEAVEAFLPYNWTTNLKKQVALLICYRLHPNLMINQNATLEKSEQLTAAVKPVMFDIKPGMILLKKGEIVNGENIKLLEASGANGQIRWPLIFMLVLSLVACSTFVGIYLYTYKRQYLFSLPTLGLIFTSSIIVCALAFPLSKNFQHFIPVPALALILTVFFGRSIASMIIFPLLILLAVAGTVNVTNLLAFAAGSCAAVLSYSKQRHDLVMTGFVIGFAQAIGYLASLAFAPPTLGMAVLGKTVLLEFLGGIVSAIISIGSLPFLENLFGLLTPFRLAELTNADQPLLRKLETDAPGTYQHSLAVANLAEAGARAIGVDANLVRAGALYHDLGKAAAPKYFIENQLGAKNPHDELTPEESREKVLNHVKNGVELATKYGLPKAIKDFIPMHQGTSLMAYFYHKACMRDGLENVDPSFYRYPGPKPHSKETAIVMLADVSEAVTHSMENPSQEEVVEALTKVLENRWSDGQLNQSTLTYKELHQVKNAFAKVWRDLHHYRPKYPTTTTGHMPVPPQPVTPHN